LAAAASKAATSVAGRASAATGRAANCDKHHRARSKLLSQSASCTGWHLHGSILDALPVQSMHAGRVSTFQRC
jgi:hypothetical protein